jgi:hypothetical protein
VSISRQHREGEADNMEELNARRLEYQTPEPPEDAAEKDRKRRKE